MPEHEEIHTVVLEQQSHGARVQAMAQRLMDVHDDTLKRLAD